MKRFFASMLLALVVPTAAATPFSQVIVFGDSNADAGRRLALQGIPLAPYFEGRHSNGITALEVVANRFGIGHTSWAVGAAFSGHGSISTDPVLAQTGMLDQYADYLTDLGGGGADADALYVLWAGVNDFSALGSNPSGALLDATSAVIIDNYETVIGGLSSIGARNFLALGRQGGAPNGYGAIFNDLLRDAMTSFAGTIDGGITTFSPLDTRNEMREIDNPFGFTHTAFGDPCYTGNFLGTTGSLCSNPDEYVFWDTRGHLTARAREVMGDAIHAALAPEPGTLILVALGLGVLTARRRRG